MAGNTLIHNSLIKQAVTATSSGALTLGSAVSGFKGYEDYEWNNLDTERVSYFLTVGSEWEYGVGEYAVATGKITRDCVYSSSSTGGITLSTGATGIIADSPLPAMHSWIGLRTGGSVSVTASGAKSLLGGGGFVSYYQSDNISLTSGDTIEIPCWCSHISYQLTGKMTEGTATASALVTITPSVGFSFEMPISDGLFSVSDHCPVWNADADGYDFTEFSITASMSATGSMSIDSVVSVQFHF